MRAVVYQAWHDTIQERVRDTFSDFALVVGRVKGEPPRMLKYEWRPEDDLWCYVAFRPLESEAFDAFVGWSTRGKFPIASANELGKAQNIWDFDAPFVLTWSMELVPRQGSAFWSFWNPPDDLIDAPEAFGKAYAEHFSMQIDYAEARQLVEPAVAKGIQEVRAHGIPYLQKRVAYQTARRAS